MSGTQEQGSGPVLSRCPTCRARPRGARRCPRCGADLSGLHRTVAAARDLRAQARRAVERDAPEEGLQAAEASLLLHHTREGRRLATLAGLLARSRAPERDRGTRDATPQPRVEPAGAGARPARRGWWRWLLARWRR